MKKISFSQWSGVALMLLIIVSLFLPWIRIEAVSTSGMIERLAGREESWVHDYLITHSRDWKAMWKAPSTGVSGYQLILWAEDETYEGQLARIASGILWGEDSGRLWMKLLVVGPLLGMAALILLGSGSLARHLLLLSGSGLVLYYLVARWRMVGAMSDVLIAELVWNIGLWLHLYAILLLGMVVLVKAINPRGR